MKKTKLNTLALAMFILLFGCQSQEKRDRKISEGFANYLLQKANTEMLNSLTPEERNGIGQVRISGRLGWCPATVEDSIFYADALKRYSDVALDHLDGARTYEDVWQSVKQAPRYAYGPGSFINENNEWEYGDSVNRGTSRELRCRANYEAYQNTIKALYIARQKQNKNK